MTQGVTFLPTTEQRRQVEVLAGLGLPQQQIALLVACDPKTLRKYFDAELSLGDAKATAKIAQTLFNKAAAGDTACMIFWMKARAGWREKHDVQVTADTDVSKLSDAELEQMLNEYTDMYLRAREHKTQVIEGSFDQN